MKKKLIIIGAAVVIVAAIVAAIVFSPKASIDRSVIEENTPKAHSVAKYLDEELELSEEDYTLVGAVGDNELYYRKSDFTLKVKNISNGNEWKSYIDEEDYIHNADKGRTENTASIAKRLKKLFEISYSNFDSRSNNSASLIEDSSATYTMYKLENGFAIETTFGIGIGITVEFWLDEDGLNVRIPKDKIKESDRYALISTSVLPMFGSTNDFVENGFMLFPDAGGAIYNIKPITDRQSPITTDVYFPSDFDLDKIEDNNQQGIKNAMMPFFGLARNHNGFVGYVTEGEMNSYITLSPSGSVFNVNRIEPAINYRKTYTYINPSGKEVTEIESDISANDFAVHYSFITAQEEKAVTYSDMANTLRAYLEKSGRLVKTESAKKEGVSSTVQTIMSVKTDSMLGEILQVMTSCTDLKNLVEGLEDGVRDNLRLMLLGWQSSGYNVYPSTGKAGSIGDIKALSKYLTENGVDSYLVDDLVYATTDSENFEKQSDAVYNEIKLPVTNARGDQYIRSPYKEYSKYVDSAIPYYEKNSVYGVGFDKIGWYVFDDAQERFKLDRLDTSIVYRAMLNETHKAGLKTAVQRGNAYILSSTDYIYDIPEKGSGYAILDEEIPFYQLVVHGYIPYSLDTPGNMAVDYTVEKLRWIETGAEPTFLLTQEMSEKFKDSKVENAFSTEFENWIDDVVSITKEFNDNLAFTGNCTIKEHQKLQDNVYKLTYSNGNKVYINYSQNQVTVDDVAVAAENYTVVEAAADIVG